MASYQKEVKKFVKEIERRGGWRVDPIKDGYQLKHEDGVGMVTIHKTPSSPRWLRHSWALVEKVEREAAARENKGQ